MDQCWAKMMAKYHSFKHSLYDLKLTKVLLFIGARTSVTFWNKQVSLRILHLSQLMERDSMDSLIRERSL